MKNKMFLCLLFLVFSYLGFSQNLNKGFISKLEITRLNFVHPLNFIQEPIINSNCQPYDYALSGLNNKIEVRYLLVNYDSNTIKINNNFPEYKKLRMLQMISTLSGGKTEKYIEYPELAVRNEFNADWGATSSIVLDCDFSRKFKFCVVSGIFKHNLGEAFVFYLCNSIEELRLLINDDSTHLYHTLTW